MAVTPLPLKLQALTAEAFAPFGDVIDTGGRQAEGINYGHTLKFADLALADTADGGGKTVLHIYRSRPVSLPLKIEIMERHALGSQAFMPLHPRPFIVVVAPAGDAPLAEQVTAFITNGQQGVNYHKGTWHHYQITLDEPGDYLVIDRAGPGENLEEHRLPRALVIETS